jgi:hypothetical protein
MSDTTTAGTEEQHKIHEGLVEFAVPVGDLHEHPDNPRLGNIDAIAESLDHNQQMKPIVAKSDGTIVAGNHTFKAAKKLGWTHVAALLLDMDDDQEKRYLLADNRVSDLAEYDLEVLQPMLSEMAEAGQLAGTGFTADDVDDMTAAMGKIGETSVADGAQYSETEDETKARFPAAQREGGQPENPMKEVMVILPAERFDVFAGRVEKLKKQWGVEGTRDVLDEAVKRAAVAEGLEGTE